MTKVIEYGKSFLLRYANDLVNFRVQELQAITSLFNIKFEWLEEPIPNDPIFLINLEVPSDIEKILSRTVLIRSAYELWSYGATRKNLHENLTLVPENFSEPFYRSTSSFKILVETFGKKISTNTKVKRIDELAFMGFDGPVRLNNPDHTFLLMEYYGTDRNFAPEDPYKLYFGRWLCDGQRNISYKINLKTRKFIGNTSMDPMLSLLMANLAHVKSGDLVLDPFVGSGGLLVAAAHFGGYVVGTDIDFLMLHGRAKPSRCNQKEREPDENILANFKQYNLESRYLDVLVADASLPLWRIPSMFDAIITDPPYGIREPTERIGTEKDYTIPKHLADGHIPSKITYSLRDILEDLLDFSSIFLKVHGHLVYWMPFYKEDFHTDVLPQHPCLALKSCCEQTLTNHSSRYLITMEKVRENVDFAEKAQVSTSMLNFREKYFNAHKKQLSNTVNKTLQHAQNL